jgi:hypothetical protein
MQHATGRNSRLAHTTITWPGCRKCPGGFQKSQEARPVILAYIFPPLRGKVEWIAWVAGEYKKAGVLFHGYCPFDTSRLQVRDCHRCVANIEYRKHEPPSLPRHHPTLAIDVLEVMGLAKSPSPEDKSAEPKAESLSYQFLKKACLTGGLLKEKEQSAFLKFCEELEGQKKIQQRLKPRYGAGEVEFQLKRVVMVCTYSVRSGYRSRLYG